MLKMWFNAPPTLCCFSISPISLTLSPPTPFFNLGVTLCFPLFLSPCPPCLTQQPVCGSSWKPDTRSSATALPRSLLLISMPSLIYALHNYHRGLLKLTAVGISVLLTPLLKCTITSPARPFSSGPAYFSPSSYPLTSTCWLPFCFPNMLSLPVLEFCSRGSYNWNIFPQKYLYVRLK